MDRGIITALELIQGSERKFPLMILPPQTCSLLPIFLKHHFLMRSNKVFVITLLYLIYSWASGLPPPQTIFFLELLDGFMLLKNDGLSCAITACPGWEKSIITLEEPSSSCWLGLCNHGRTETISFPSATLLSLTLEKVTPLKRFPPVKTFHPLYTVKNSSCSMRK